jgi:phosphoribosylanthranilate isomerase
VKICGLTRVDEALACVEAGADWLGLNFHPPSPRFVSVQQARQIVASLPRDDVAVGLFVNRPVDEVARLADEAGVRIIQLHGDEPPEHLRALDRFRIVRAFRLGGVDDVARLRDYLSRAEALGRPPDAVLVDASVMGQFGGTGALVSEDLLSLLPPLPRLILAGGLTPANVAARIAQVSPWMVDAASGVESLPGRKDPAKVAAFIREARSATPPSAPG